RRRARPGGVAGVPRLPQPRGPLACLPDRAAGRGPPKPDADLRGVPGLCLRRPARPVDVPPDLEARRVLAAGREPARQDGAAPPQARADPRPDRAGPRGLLPRRHPLRDPVQGGRPAAPRGSPRPHPPPRLAARLAPILGDPARDVLRRLTVAKKFAPVRRRLNPDMARAVRDLKDPSLALVEDSLRLYPSRELAAQLVGFEGAEGKGRAGIEQAWDAHLAGVEGRAVVERDALGREVTGAPLVLKPSVAGQGIVLTIDTTIQYLAEKEVDAAWRRTRAKSAMAVVMDPRTGE